MTTLVVGGGPAGSAAAIGLARSGQDVILAERSQAPTNKVCGEFLSREACLYLRDLGIELEALGALPLRVLRFCHGEQCSETVLPFTAMSLSRRALDEALLERALQAGVDLRRGHQVTHIDTANSPVSGSVYCAHVVGTANLRADALFLASGKHDLHSHKRAGGLHNDLVAFKMHFDLVPRQWEALGDAVELILFEGGYAGLQPVENGAANLCLLVEKRRLRAAGGGFTELLRGMCEESPYLARRLAGARARWKRPLAVSSIPFGFVRDHSEGIWYLGDQAAVIPSFSGDGISIALHSAALACNAFLEGQPASAYQQRLARDLRSRVLGATALSRALVSRSGQRVAGALASLWPGILTLVASRTRIPEAALARVRDQKVRR